MMDGMDTSVASSIRLNADGSVSSSMVDVDSYNDNSSSTTPVIHASSNMEVTGHQMNQMRQALQRQQQRRKTSTSAASSVYSQQSIMSHDSSDSGSNNEEQSLYDIDLDGNYTKKKVRRHRRKPKSWEQAQALKQTKRLFRLALVSNGLFVMGSILFVWVSVKDLSIAQLAQQLPEQLQNANDDAVWNQWYWEQELHKKLTKGGGGGESDTAGNTRKLQILATNYNKNKQQQQQQQNQVVDLNTALWKELPQKIQQALATLGHDEQTWDRGATSDIEEMPWDDLTEEQQAAADVVGYTAESWDAEQELEEEEVESGTSATDATDGTEATDEYDEDEATGPTEWNEDDSKTVMSAVQGVLTNEFGGTGATPTVPTDNVGASTTAANAVEEQLQNSVQQAVVEEIKNDVPFESEEPLYHDATNYHQLMVWGNVTWAEMPDDIKAAFQILGYTNELWTSGGTAYTEDLYWDELNPDQQEAALFLGYTKLLWDKAEEDEGTYPTPTDGTDPTDAIPGLQAPTTAMSDEPVQEETPAPPAPTEPAPQEPEQTDKDVPVPPPPPPKIATIAEADPDFDYREEEKILSVMGVDIYQTQLIYLAAALCFMVVGLIDWIRDSLLFHVWMVQGGMFGVLSALLVEVSDIGALILQTISVHCFLVEALFMLKLRKTLRPIEGLQVLSTSLWIADVCFGMGSALKVVINYWHHFDDEAKYDTHLAGASVLSSILWMVCAFVYVASTVILTRKTDSLITSGGVTSAGDNERNID